MVLCVCLCHTSSCRFYTTHNSRISVFEYLCFTFFLLCEHNNVGYRSDELRHSPDTIKVKWPATLGPLVTLNHISLANISFPYKHNETPLSSIGGILSFTIIFFLFKNENIYHTMAHSNWCHFYVSPFQQNKKTVTTSWWSVPSSCVFFFLVKTKRKHWDRGFYGRENNAIHIELSNVVIRS